jgi:hypothetical protein
MQEAPKKWVLSSRGSRLFRARKSLDLFLLLPLGLHALTCPLWLLNAPPHFLDSTLDTSSAGSYTMFGN